jgi:hypothetical protein
MMSQIVVCLESALVYFTVCAAFMTCDRHPHQFALAGLAIALERMARAQSSMDTLVAPNTAVPIIQHRPLRSFPRSIG